MDRLVAKNARILITGANGFLGGMLFSSLNSKNIQVKKLSSDLLDKSAVADEIASFPPSIVFHFAAKSHPLECASDPSMALAANFTGTQNLVEALRKQSEKIRFVFASTAQVYQAPDPEESRSGIVFREDRSLVPQNVYADTKLKAENWLKEQATDVFSVVALRFFSFTHCTQSPRFFLPSVYQSLLGLSNHEGAVPVGNLELTRDFSGRTQFLSAMSALLQKDKEEAPFVVFNLCSGEKRNLRDLAETLAAYLKIKAEFILDPNRLRPGEPVSIVGDNSLFSKYFDWHPQLLSTSGFIKDFLNKDKI